MNTHALRLMAVAVTALLAGCGGGGGGSGFSGSTSAEPVEITAANATDVAGTTLRALEGASALAAVALSITFGVIVPLDAGGGASAQSAGGGPAPAAVVTETLDCVLSGTVTVTTDVATAGTLVANDTVRTAFANCNDGEGLILDGTLDLRVLTFAGNLNAGLFLLTTDATVDRLLITVDGDSVELDGDVGLDIDTTQDPLLSVSIEGDGSGTLEVEVNAEAGTLRDFFMVVDTDLTDPDTVYTRSAGGTFDSEAIGPPGGEGRVTFETIDELVERDSQQYPEAGQIEIFGDDSSVLVTDSTADAVLLDVDSDGNGQYEETIATTWPDLVP